MKRGLSMQERFEQLEPRRTLSKYGFEQGLREFRKSFFSEELGIKGEIDLLLTLPDKNAVVEFKSGDTKIWSGHILQLTAYAMLSEYSLGVPCPVGFLFYHDQKKIEEVLFTEEHRNDTRKIIDQIKYDIVSQVMPSPPGKQKQCPGCEYKNFCGDIY